MNVWGLTDRGRVRPQNQDAFEYACEADKGMAILVVCDGMGGAKAGNVASVTAVCAYMEALKARLKPNAGLEEIAEKMLTSIQIANTAVYEKGLHNLDYNGMGTTLVTAVSTKKGTVVANVGDSRAYRIWENGIEQLTRDHSIVEDMVVRGDITRAEARHHPNRNLITRALGTGPKVEADIFYPELDEGELILLCSDGLSNLLEEQEILFEVLHGGPRDNCCARMLDIALNRGASDNVTIVLFEK
jgi:serine/threonine protein phosphatase PrpC